MFKGLFDLLVGFAAVLDVPPSCGSYMNQRNPKH